MEKTLKWIGIAVIVMGVLYAFAAWTGHRALQRAYQALEEDGRPMTIAEILPPALEDRDNAALVYEAAVLLLRSEPAGEENLYSELAKLASRILEDERDAEAEEAFLALSRRPAAQTAFEQIRSSSRKKGCWHDIDLSKGAALELPHLQIYLKLSRIVAAQARLEAESGNGPGAWEGVLTSLRLADSLRREPLLISQLVRAAQFQVAVSTLRHVAARELPDRRQERELLQLLEEFEDPSALALALDGERIGLAEWAFNLPSAKVREELAEQGGGLFARWGLFFSIVHPRDHAAYLEVMRTYSKNAEVPYSKEDAGLDEELLRDIPVFYYITRLVTPELSSIKRNIVTMWAEARVARAGLVVLRKHEETGTWPDTLPDSASLVDPFGGEPLRFRSRPNGFLLYSIGPNLADDEGRSKPEKQSDIAWNHPAR